MAITPSAISQQLAILKGEAGVELLEKSGRGVRLTEAGIVLVRHADVVSEAIETAEAELAALRHEVTGTLRVAAFPTAARALMPSVIVALGQDHPNLRVTLKDYETPESLAALRLDDIDVALVDEYDEATTIRDEGITAHVVLADELYVAMAATHPLARPEVDLADLRNEFWIMDAESSRLFQRVLVACQVAGFEPHIRSHCKDYSVMIALVEAGLGVAVLPGLALRDRSVRLTVGQLRPRLGRRILVAVRAHRRPSPAIRSIVGLLCDENQVRPWALVADADLD